MTLRRVAAFGAIMAFALGGCASAVHGSASAGDSVSTVSTGDPTTDPPPDTSSVTPPAPPDTSSVTAPDPSTDSRTPVPPVDPTTPPPPPTSSATGGTSVLDRAPFADATLVDPSAFPGMVSDYGFVTPSGNILCGFYADGTVCQIAEYDFTPPAKPAECGDTGWGNNFGVDDTAGGFMFCAGDVEGGGPVLEYGQMIGINQYYCVSREEGVTCVNTKHEGGFTLSRAGYTLF